MKRCGLLGEKLGHSYSPAIHAELADYEYRLYEVAPEKLGEFLTGGGFDGMNVTIPYKKAVIPYCAKLSPIAQKLQSVNVLVRREDGTLYGDNADAYGFAGMVRASGVQIDGKKTLVLGSGGASSTVCAVLEEMGARSVTIISRKGEDNYNNLDRHADAEVIVNTTPVGMYPNCGVSPVDLSLFPKLEGVLDIVYNPARTAFVLQAEKLGIPYMSGLYMLVAQAKRTAEVFENRDIPDSETERIWKKLSLEMQNIVLVGMPGSGKSTVAARLAEKLDRIALDSDAEIEEKNGMSCAQLIEKHGEAEFRELESEAIAALGKRSGAVIATGGGCVTREENYDLLHQNGIIFWLKRDIDQLPQGLLRKICRPHRRQQRHSGGYCAGNFGLPEIKDKTARRNFAAGSFCAMAAATAGDGEIAARALRHSISRSSASRSPAHAGRGTPRCTAPPARSGRAAPRRTRCRGPSCR